MPTIGQRARENQVNEKKEKKKTTTPRGNAYVYIQVIKLIR